MSDSDGRYQRIINENCIFNSTDNQPNKRYCDQACYSSINLVNNNNAETFVVNAPEIISEYCLNTNNIDIFRDGSGTLIPKISTSNNRWSMINYPFFYSKICQKDLSKFLLTSSKQLTETTTTKIRDFCGRFPVFQTKDSDPLPSTNVAPYSGILNMNNFDYDSKSVDPPQSFINFYLFGAGTFTNSNSSFDVFKQTNNSSNRYINTIGLRFDNPITDFGFTKPFKLTQYSKKGILYMRRDTGGSTLLQGGLTGNLTYYEFLISYFTSKNQDTKVERPLGQSLRFMIRTNESDSAVISDTLDTNPTLNDIPKKDIQSEPSLSFITGFITGINDQESQSLYYTGFDITNIYVSSPRILQINFGCINYVSQTNPFGKFCKENDTSDDVETPSNGFNWYEIPDPTDNSNSFFRNRGISFLFDIYGFFDSTNLYYNTSDFLKNQRPLQVTYISPDYTNQKTNIEYTINNLFPDFDGDVPLTFYNTSASKIYDLCTCNLDGGTSQNPSIYRNFYTTFIASLNINSNAYQQIYQDVNSSGTSTTKCIFPRCSVTGYPSSDIVNNFSNPPSNTCQPITCIQIIEIDSTGSFSGNVNAFNECNDNSPNNYDPQLQSEIDKIIISFSIIIAIVVLVGIVIAIILFIKKK